MVIIRSNSIADGYLRVCPDGCQMSARYVLQGVQKIGICFYKRAAPPKAGRPLRQSVSTFGGLVEYLERSHPAIAG